MKIGITDSGVGGLSVCAEFEARLRQSPVREDIEIIYLNAAIEDDYSYNSMPDRQTKLQAFDRFLDSVREKYQPDLLFIACNTLSVLYRDSHFDHHRHTPIEGIVGSGTREMLAAFTHDNDGSGLLASQLLRKFVPAALEQFDSSPSNVVAFLGCTHYGYQAGQFKRVLQALVPNAQVLNPNRGAVDTIFSRLKTEPGHGSLTVKFITRYAIPDVVISSLSAYIGELAPGTLSALKNFTHLPGLCGEL